MKTSSRTPKVRTPELRTAGLAAVVQVQYQLVQVQFLADYGQHMKGDTVLLPESEAQALPSHAAHVLGGIPQSALCIPHS